MECFYRVPILGKNAATSQEEKCVPTPGWNNIFFMQFSNWKKMHLFGNHFKCSPTQGIIVHPNLKKKLNRNSSISATAIKTPTQNYILSIEEFCNHVVGISFSQQEKNILPDT